MVTIIIVALVVLVARDFYSISLFFNKNPIKYSLFGILVYTVGIVLGYFILTLVIKFLEIGSWNFLIPYAKIVIPIPFGILICTAYQKYLKKSWKTDKEPNSEIIDEDLYS